MEDAGATVPSNSKREKSAQEATLGEGVADGQSECERVMAEAKAILRELLVEPRQWTVEPTRAANASPREPARRSVFPRSLAGTVDRLCLDPDLDFVVRGEGLIEMTEAGVRRMMQAQCAGLDVVIEINGREALRFLAPKGAHELAAGRPTSEQPPKFANPADSIVRRTQPVDELLKAEESTEDALQMINKERKRFEIELLLPWHATGTLSQRDAERVEQALAEDDVLAHQYELLLEELAAAVSLNESLGSPSDRAMEKLFAAIDAEEAQLPRSRRRSFGETAAAASGSR